ncbi:MAG: hypothetical protein ACI4LN_02690 [Anaerovoracaceae bacterium]
MSETKFIFIETNLIIAHSRKKKSIVVFFDKAKV